MNGQRAARMEKLTKMDVDEQMQALALKLLQKERSALDGDEVAILKKFVNRTPVSRDLSDDGFEETFWDSLADRVAAVGGSWAFIFGFFGVLLGWMLLNTEILATWKMAFDPYPYIFLNLMLSMIAAIQAPIIMMSQNRQTKRDRVSAQHDYEVNLKSELEVMSLHEKWDRSQIETLKGLLEEQARQLGSISDFLEIQGRPTP